MGKSVSLLSDLCFDHSKLWLAGGKMTARHRFPQPWRRTKRCRRHTGLIGVANGQPLPAKRDRDRFLRPMRRSGGVGWLLPKTEVEILDENGGRFMDASSAVGGEKRDIDIPVG